jgi:hypothetical protein
VTDRALKPGWLERDVKRASERVAEWEHGRKAHKVMTPEEYAAMPIIGWHEVCRNVDGFGAIGIRFLGTEE